MENNASRTETILFFFTILLAGLCSLIYELLISTTSSFFLGDSVKQFSLTIGIYMAAMGVGSYFTKYFKDDLLSLFVKTELALGLVGGISIPVLYFVFDKVEVAEYQMIMLGLTFLIGILTGFEIPLLVRILKEYYPLESNLAYVLSLDYIGALIATLIFPFFFLPMVGTFKTSLIFGMVNIALGIIVYRYFVHRFSLKKDRKLQWLVVGVFGFFLTMISVSDRLLGHWEDSFFTSKIIHSEQTPYQYLVLTKNKKDVRLYINRIIQFSSRDEYRYHEALGLLPLEVAPYKKSVLILGGGEGLLAREILKSSDVEKVTIVDLDGAVFKMAKENKYLREINKDALWNDRVELVTQDAFSFLNNSGESFDLIIGDLPDPSNDAVARLYSDSFYKLVKNRLSRFGVFATQATSPFHSRNAFWCISSTLDSVFNNVYPYHVYVPSFGDWGFVLASDFGLSPEKYEQKLPSKYMDSLIVKKMFYFENDINKPTDIEINKLDSPELLDYYLKEWELWRKEKIH